MQVESEGELEDDSESEQPDSTLEDLFEQSEQLSELYD